ncbi:hypothetical protein EW146_g6500 [Bondarzewia mesenterica]|uniref:Uncharacterized protein n=1 Tax=Bondarzewia mesenterica TaxID=1095465 RepID=A0A4S4LQ82_9AGAM|nr:hypothetical protein EW146_g6500 [Bondarzewia mesenterica]
MDHYSSIFTSGLLSQDSFPPRKLPFWKQRKTSLPTSSLTVETSFTLIPSTNDPDSSLYFTIKPTRPRESLPSIGSPDQYRSFLSLDLAESQSMRSARTRSDLSSIQFAPPPSIRTPLSDPSTPSAMQPPPSPDFMSSLPSSSPSSRRRSSRESLRHLPLPKPAPSSSLPEPPFSTLAPPSVPHTPITPRSLPPLITSFPLFPAMPPTLSRRSSSSLILTPGSSSKSASVLPSSARRVSRVSLVSTATSVRTPSKRIANRSDALACLEGRSRAPNRISRTSRQRNFISLSDDEDDEFESVDVSISIEAPEETKRDTRIPAPAASLSHTNSAQSLSVSTIPRIADEDEDRVLPVSPLSREPPTGRPHRASVSPAPKMCRRRSTMESWFPLANFIDLRDDDFAGWRGVVEIMTAV